MICVYTVGSLSQAMRQEVIALHTEAFSDSRAWICGFLAAADDERYLAFTEEGRLLGGMFLLSATLCGGGKTLCGDYIFALCVRRAFRGRGIAASLLDFAKETAKDFLLLVPASRDLFRFYTARGFTVRLPACTSADGRGTAADLCGCVPGGDYADALAAAKTGGGLLLGAPLFAYALAERGLTLCKNGEGLFAVKDGEVFAAFGALSSCNVKEEKALAYVKEGTLPRVLCDLLFEE